MASHDTAWHSLAQSSPAWADPRLATPDPCPPSQTQARPYHIGVLLQCLLGAIVLVAGAWGAAAVQPHQGTAPVVAGEAAVWGQGQDRGVSKATRPVAPQIQLVGFQAASCCVPTEVSPPGPGLGGCAREGYWCPVEQGLCGASTGTQYPCLHRYRWWYLLPGMPPRLVPDACPCCDGVGAPGDSTHVGPVSVPHCWPVPWCPCSLPGLPSGMAGMPSGHFRCLVPRGPVTNGGARYGDAWWGQLVPRCLCLVQVPSTGMPAALRGCLVLGHVVHAGGSHYCLVLVRGTR